MKYLKTFEKYGQDFYELNINLEYVKNLNKEQMLKFIESQWEDGIDEDKEEAIFSSLSELKSMLSNYNESDTITLFRILNTYSEEEIRRDRLGEHYITSLNNIDSLFIRDIGLNPSMNMYSVEVKARVSDINFNKTIISNVDYPYEMEITLLDDSNIEIINIKPFEVTR